MDINKSPEATSKRMTQEDTGTSSNDHVLTNTNEFRNQNKIQNPYHTSLSTSSSTSSSTV